MSFKTEAQKDIQNVFLNASEFAEIRTVRYDGEYYYDIPIVLTQHNEKRPMQNTAMSDFSGKLANKSQGLHAASVKAFISLKDMRGVEPEQKRPFEISDGRAAGRVFFREYYIKIASCEMGMICLELEEIDE